MHLPCQSRLGERKGLTGKALCTPAGSARRRPRRRRVAKRWRPTVMISPGRGTQASATGANAGCCLPRCCWRRRAQLGIGQRLQEFLPHDVITLRGITVRRPPRFQHRGILAGGNRLRDELLDGVDVRRGLLGRSGAVDEDAAVLLGSVVENSQHHRLAGGGETARLHVEVPVGEHVLHFPAVGDHVGEGFACCLAGGVDEGRRPAISPGGVLGHAREKRSNAIFLCRRGAHNPATTNTRRLQRIGDVIAGTLLGTQVSLKKKEARS